MHEEELVKGNVKLVIHLQKVEELVTLDVTHQGLCLPSGDCVERHAVTVNGYNR